MAKGTLALTSLALTPLFDRWTFAAAHRYKLAPESILPADIRKAPVEVREAYRFAIANRDTLRYIPCYCDCGDQGTRATLLVIFKTTQHRKSRYLIE